MKTKAKLLLAAIAGLTTAASADTIYKTGFEDPPFAKGLLVAFNPDGSPANDGWVAPPPLSPNAALISTKLLRQGKQSVVVKGVDLVSQPVLINVVTNGYYDAIGSYRRSVDFDSLGRKSVRISAHVRVNGRKTPDGNNFYSASITGRGTTPEGTVGLGELAVSSDGHAYAYSGNEDGQDAKLFLVRPQPAFWRIPKLR